MTLQTIDIDSVKISFDKEKTQAHRTDFNKPCGCQDCRNYFANVEKNQKLVEFLSGFGIDYRRTEEVCSCSSEFAKDLVHSTAYYAVYGSISVKETSFERFSVKLSFTNEEYINNDRVGEYFFVTVEGDFPFILDENRED